MTDWRGRKRRVDEEQIKRLRAFAHRAIQELDPIKRDLKAIIDEPVPMDGDRVMALLMAAVTAFDVFVTSVRARHTDRPLNYRESVAVKRRTQELYDLVEQFEYMLVEIDEDPGDVPAFDIEANADKIQTHLEKLHDDLAEGLKQVSVLPEQLRGDPSSYFSTIVRDLAMLLRDFIRTQDNFPVAPLEVDVAKDRHEVALPLRFPENTVELTAFCSRYDSETCYVLVNSPTASARVFDSDLFKFEDKTLTRILSLTGHQSPINQIAYVGKDILALCSHRKVTDEIRSADSVHPGYTGRTPQLDFVDLRINALIGTYYGYEYVRYTSLPMKGLDWLVAFASNHRFAIAQEIHSYVDLIVVSLIEIRIDAARHITSLARTNELTFSGQGSKELLHIAYDFGNVGISLVTATASVAPRIEYFSFVAYDTWEEMLPHDGRIVLPGAGDALFLSLASRRIIRWSSLIEKKLKMSRFGAIMYAQQDNSDYDAHMGTMQLQFNVLPTSFAKDIFGQRRAEETFKTVFALGDWFPPGSAPSGHVRVRWDITVDGNVQVLVTNELGQAVIATLRQDPILARINNERMQTAAAIHDQLKCTVCSNVTSFVCDGCKKMPYCTVDCQKKHWREHAEECEAPMNQ